MQKSNLKMKIIGHIGPIGSIGPIGQRQSRLNF